MSASHPPTQPHPAPAGGDPPREGSRGARDEGGQGRWRRVVSAQESGLVLVIALLMLALAVAGGSKPKRVLDGATGRPATVQVNKFLDPQNLVLLAKDASFIAIMAVGMTGIITLGGIDLSIGSIYALAAVVGAMALHEIGAPPTGPPGSPESVAWWLSVPLGLAVCVGIGALCGATNGALIVGLRVHPFIITLGTMAVIRGVVFVLTEGQSIGGFPESFTRGFFKAEIAGVYPVPVVVMVVVALAGVVMLSRTVLGRRVYAIGGNETAARYAGVPVGRVKLIVFTLAGALAGLSACVYLGYFGAAEPNAGNGYELRVIAAAVIGGASLSGGRGSAVGAVLGAIVIELINNAMIILEIDQNYNQIVMGAAIVLAVVLDQAKGRFVGAAR